jgi:hypothetical protein
MTTIRARLNDAAEGVSSSVVFGNELTRDYAEIEVSDEVLAKLKGNPTIDVLIRTPKGSAQTAAPAVEPQPSAPDAPADTAPAVDAPQG